MPAAYGWLALDRRGRWLVGGGPVTHPGANAFLGRNYDSEAGCWFVQNGPQRAFVTLAVAPFVLSLEPSGLRTHTGAGVARPTSLIVADGGDLLLATEHGLGLVCDRDLTAFVAELSLPAPGGADPLRYLLEPPADDAGEAVLWRGQRLPVRRLAPADLPGEFGFVRDPKPPPA